MSKTLLSCAVVCASFAFMNVAEAARCPQGEIYRPSRGVCVSKTSAINAGIYRPGVRRQSVRVADDVSTETPSTVMTRATRNDSARTPEASASATSRAVDSRRTSTPRDKATDQAATSPYGSFDRNPLFDAEEAKFGQRPDLPLAYAADAPIRRQASPRPQSAARVAPANPPRQIEPSLYGGLVALEPAP